MTAPPPAGNLPADEHFGPDDAETWHRVHPVSPMVKGWIGIIAVILVFGRGIFEDLIAGRGMPQYGPGGDTVPLWIIAGGLILVILLFALGFFLSWYFTRYQVTDQHVRVNSGIVFRQHRQARLDRVQAIDVVQPLLARLFSLAELKFEVADSGSSAVRLSYLRLSTAQQLRATILARASGAEPDPEHPDQVSEAPEQPVLALSGGRIVGATLLSGTTIFVALAVIAVAVVAGAVDEPFALGAVLAGAVPILFAVAAAYWTTFSNSYNFRAATSPDGIRLRYGLLDTRAQTVPPGRVQAVGIVQSPLWRLKGWYKMQVNVAGYGVDTQASGSRTTLLPAGTSSEVMQMLALVLPDPGTEDPFDVFGAALGGRDQHFGFTTTPRRGRILDLLSWRRNGFTATATALICRSGWLWRAAQVVPHERTQSLALHQGPLTRRLRLADVVLHSTPGPVTARVVHADLDVARQLFEEQADRAAQARRVSAPEHWLAPRRDDGESTESRRESGPESSPEAVPETPQAAGPAPEGPNERDKDLPPREDHNGQ
ncbi:PH domain-containing protein [Arthrobacter castelli]|uniref:PH domain-containing protein n=1 Tax=Arthrobacter castelli TaxID=271431 RepID=UPI0003F90826|nr:PH domain-containing protein [Arthrobacter castelli]